MRLIDVDDLILTILTYDLCGEDNVDKAILNAPTINAIPIEWLKQWEEKHKNDPCYCMFVSKEILADWEKENEGKTN